MAVVGPLTLSYRGTLIQPQDVSTILLSLSAGAIAAQPAISAEAAFSTVVTLVGVTSIATGLTAYTMGVLKLGYLVRFVPFPVVSGFLAASGVLLVRGAFGMVAPCAGFADLMSLWPLWLPWLAVSLVIVAVSRLSSSGLAIPLLLLLTLAGFFAVTGILGLDFAAMREIGLLLGPFQGGSFLDGINPALLQNVQWSALLAQTPVIASIIGVSMLGMLLNASGLELAIEREIDFERELKGVGMANVAAGLMGGLGGYHILSETLLARRFGLAGAAAGFGLAAALVIVLFFGADAVLSADRVVCGGRVLPGVRPSAHRLLRPRHDDAARRTGHRGCDAGHRPGLRLHGGCRVWRRGGGISVRHRLFAGGSDTDQHHRRELPRAGRTVSH